MSQFNASAKPSDALDLYIKYFTSCEGYVLDSPGFI